MRILILTAIVVSGCATLGPRGSAQERKAERGVGGVIALQGDRERALEQARPWMAERCGGPYRITSEEEVIIGTNPRAWAGGSHPTELRVSYACGATAPAAAASR